MVYPIQPNQYVKIIVEDVQYKLPRETLVTESDNLQIHNNSSSVLPLPQWVTKSVYELLERYLKTKQIKFLLNHTQNHNTIIKLLRTSDFLGLNNFHQQYITQVIIPSLNQQNCIVLLQQTQKKLKNLDNGAQCWFSLLNSTINYVATHIFEIFKQDPQKLKKMNDKIMNQVFDRAIRFEKKSQLQGRRHLLFQLILESKNVKKVSELCKNQRLAILQKKINAKIHAKLSWKLQNVAAINDKKTKNFKFLDLDWYLSAVRDPSKRVLNISLNLLSKPNKEKQQQDSFTKIGVFYTKLIRTVDGNSQQSAIQINYISFNQPKNIVFLSIDEQYERQLGNKKLELNIYCSLQQIYTFILNYIIQNFDKFENLIKQFTKEETIAIISALKRMKRYSEALKASHELLFKDQLSNVQCAQIFQGYVKQQLSSFEQSKLKHLKKNRQLTSGFKTASQEQFVAKDKAQMLINGTYSNFRGRDRLSEGTHSSTSSNPYRIFSERESQTSIQDNKTNFQFPDKFTERLSRKSPFQSPLQHSQNQSIGQSSKPSIYDFQFRNQNTNFNYRNQPLNAFLVSGKTQITESQRISSEYRNQKIAVQGNSASRNANGSYEQNKKHEAYSRAFDQKSCQLKKSDSRTRPRKIFNNSPSKILYQQPPIVHKNDGKVGREQIVRITDLRNYITNKDSSLARILAI